MRRLFPFIILLSVLAGLSSASFATSLPVGEPIRLGMSAERLAEADQVVTQGLKEGVYPGAVLLVARRGHVVFSRAYGTAKLDSIFDLASMTKPLVTALTLAQLGTPPSDLLTRYLPLTGAGMRTLTLEHVLLHRGGFIPDNPLKDYENGPERAFQIIYQMALQSPPGRRFRYSDVGYIVLGRLIEKLTGQPLHQRAQAQIFAPLGLTDTTFRPNRGSPACPRCLPTDPGEPHGGRVNDPIARALGGVAGHAGLFSTASDVAVLVQTILNCGQGPNGVRLLSREATQRMMHVPASLPTQEWRSLGWDVDTDFSAPRGEIYPIGSFGHTGYTGTSVWADPSSQSFVVLLTNRSANDTRVRRKAIAAGALAIKDVRAQVATAVARAIIAAPWPSAVPINDFCSGGGR